ncbi:MAG: MarR family transcriptional regulator [Chloroflexi bacterium]|nr:MarR family transcriptional regulator [Chloroflexota bacterium]
MQRSALDVLESLTVGSVAVTARAIAQSGVELTFAQWRVLQVVADGPDGRTVGEIAARLAAANSPASRLVTRMRRRNLVTTEQDERDHRATRVRLTEQGREVRDRVIARRRALLAEAISAAPDLPEASVERLAELGSILRAFE